MAMVKTLRSTSDYPFARFTIMPNASSRGPLTSGETLSVGQTTKKFYAGLARIDLYYSRSGNTATTALTAAESVIDAFTPTTITLADSQLNIEASWFEEMRQEQSAIGLPVFIRWSNYSL
jgi:hypothetical protein